MLEQFKQHIATQFPELLSGTSLVTVSGGCDSVVLTYLMQATGLKFGLAHCNFKLRGNESDGDQAFVEQLAQKLGTQLHVHHFDTKNEAAARKTSTQMAARDLRYEWFEALRAQHKYTAILTGHHLDDQLETFLINLNRGAGLDGLTGIKARNQFIYRPLLIFTRDNITTYAAANSIQWREDASNASNDYQRNQLRNQVLPLLHDALPDLRAHLNDTFGYLKGAQDMVDDAVVRFRESVIQTTPTQWKIPIAVIKAQSNPAAYVYELLKEQKPNMVDMMALLDAQTGKKISCGSCVILKDRAHILVEMNIVEKDEGSRNISDFNAIYTFNKQQFECKVVATHSPLAYVKDNVGKNVLLLDASGINGRMQLRGIKNGDTLQPYGMHGTKRVSDLLIDAKIPLLDKEKVVVLTYNHTILWVAGIRASIHHKITDKTKNIIQVTQL